MVVGLVNSVDKKVHSHLSTTENLSTRAPLALKKLIFLKDILGDKKRIKRCGGKTINNEKRTWQKGAVCGDNFSNFLPTLLSTDL